MSVRAHALPFGPVRGRPVVFVHGLEDSWASWLPVAAELDPSWRLVALDLPWRAGNDYRWRSRRPEEWLADGLALLDEFPAAVVAHSFGANAALRMLCAGDPRLSVAVVLVCPLYRPPGQPVTWRLFELARSRFVEHVRDSLLARMSVRSRSVDAETLELMVDATLNRVGPHGFITTFDEYVTSAELPLAEIRVPTLLVAGDADHSLPAEAAGALGRAIPAAQYTVNAGYDHFCQVRRPRGVAAQVGRFLARTSTPTLREPQ